MAFSSSCGISNILPPSATSLPVTDLP